MSAQSIDFLTIDFPDPLTINYNNNVFNTLDTSVSFTYGVTNNIRTLSTKNVQVGATPRGILYVPNLESDRCITAEQDHIPANVTRIADLPNDRDYALIAVAPWFDPKCVQEYFDAARNASTKAFITYQNGDDNNMPPVLDDASWDLRDGGAWQSLNTFPTYALSPMRGGIITNEMGRYSSNLTSVPNGQELLKKYASTDYVRLWAVIATNASNGLPSLWVFLVIVLAILLLAVSSTSIGMHFIHRRRRRHLERRVIAGEVDLEALGVKRLVVPQNILDKFPIHMYTVDSPDDIVNSAVPTKGQPHAPSSRVAGAKTEQTSSPETAPISLTPTAPSTFTAFSQPTCPICLDDFEVNKTQVRELPCRHVFHPDCIDTFLLRNSSLCPLCKHSVLPKGQCPVQITNLMVRRERHIQHMRSQGGQTVIANIFNSTFRRRNTAGATQTQPRLARSDIEMAAEHAATPSPPTISPSLLPPARQTRRTSHRSSAELTSPTGTGQHRREWARQRALALLGHRRAPEEESFTEQSRPTWRRALRKVFPGF